MVFEKVRDVIAEQLGVEPDDITPETNLTKDLEADSLDAVEIVMALEEEYGIEIPDDKVEEFQVVGNIVKFIEDQL